MIKIVSVTLWSKIIFWWTAESWLFRWRVCIFGSCSGHPCAHHKNEIHNSVGEGWPDWRCPCQLCKWETADICGQHVLGMSLHGQGGAGRSGELVEKCRQRRRKGARKIIKDTHSLLKIHKALLQLHQGCRRVGYPGSCAPGAASPWCRKNASRELQLCCSSNKTEQQPPDACCYFCVCCWHRGSYGLLTGSCSISLYSSSEAQQWA